MYRLISTIAVAAAIFTTLDARAQSVEQARSDFAQQVYATASADIDRAAPQPLLRAVVVMRVRLSNSDGWTGEVIRDNPTQPEMTQKALASVGRAQVPATLDTTLREELRREGFVEIWLFQSDGRFSLRTLAPPQRDV